MPKIIQLGSTYAKGQTPYQIFQDRMSAVQGIANGIKKIRENVYTNKVMQQMIDEIDVWKDQQQTDTDIFKFKYQENQENEINESAAIFADILHNQAMGTMRQKEIMMGNLPAPTTGAEALGGIPAMAEPQTEGFAIPKGSMEMIWNYVRSAGGAVDFSKTLELMKNRPKWMGMTDLDTSILNYTMNQPTGMERLGQTADISKAIQSILFPNLAQQQELATYQAKSQIDIDEFRAKEEIEAAFEKGKGTKWFNTTYGMFNADKGEYVRPDDSITVADYQLFSLSDSSGKSKVLAVDKNNPYSPAVEVPGFDKYFEGKQTTGVSDATTGNLRPLTNAQIRNVRDDIKKCNTLEEARDILKTEGVTHDITPLEGAIEEIMPTNIANYSEQLTDTLDYCWENIEKGTFEDDNYDYVNSFESLLKNYEQAQAEYSELTGERLPDYPKTLNDLKQAQKGTLGKLKDVITKGNDNQILLNTLMAQAKGNWQDALTWIKENKGKEIEDDNRNVLNIDWEELEKSIRKMQEIRERH